MASPLLSLTPDQWENLCDGCGRCCLVKLQDEDTEEIHYTNVACRFLDSQSCQCIDYQNRAQIKPECVVLDKNNLETLKMMPFTCAYRLKHEGRELEHHRIQSLKVTDRVISEEYIHEEQLPDHIIDWISIE